LGDELTREGYFGNGAADVQLRRDHDGYLLVMIGKWAEPTPTELRRFQTLADELADALAPMSINLALAEDDFEIKTRVPRLPRVKIGSVVIYTLEGATADDARQLVDALVKAQIIKTDEEHRYELRRDGDGYSVSVTIHEGKWDDAKIIAAYSEFASVLGKRLGKPVRYRLCADGFVVKRTVP
jgi:hypothetical protein